MSCSMALRRSPKPGAFTATLRNVPRILLTTSVARASPSTSSDEHQDRLAGLHDLLEHRQQVLHRADLAVRDEDVGVLEDRLHALGVGDEVRRDVALVEPHALDEVELHAEGVGLLDGDDAVLADLVDGLGDRLADLGVGGGDGADLGDLVLAVDLLGLVLDGLDGELGGALDAALERHRVGAGRDVAQAFLHDRLGEHGGRRRAVTGDVVGLLGDLLDELGADLLLRVVELDLLGDRDAVVRDRGGAPLLLEDHVAALGAERDLDGVGELVHAPLERTPCFLVEGDDLRSHPFSSSAGRSGFSACGSRLLALDDVPSANDCSGEAGADDKSGSAGGRLRPSSTRETDEAWLDTPAWKRRFTAPADSASRSGPTPPRTGSPW